eukprot:g2179.t1
MDPRSELNDLIETNNRPVIATGEIGECSYTCNDQPTASNSCNGVLRMHCSKTYPHFYGWKINATIENTCEGVYSNATDPSADKGDIQIRVSCDGIFRTKFNVSSTTSNGFGSRLSLDYKCIKAFSSVTNKDLGKHGELGLNFYQNTLCKGTETSKLVLTAPGDDSIFSEFGKKRGGFLKTSVGSCDLAASVLSTIDIFGVLYSYMIIPDCELNSGELKAFSQVIQPALILCNGVSQIGNKPCSGLLLAISQLDDGTASFKCRGKYVVKDNIQFNCTGETHGEQMRKGPDRAFVRSNVCAGKSSENPFHGMVSDDLFYEGATSICIGAAVKATIIGPPPFVKKHTKLPEAQESD